MFNLLEDLKQLNIYPELYGNRGYSMRAYAEEAGAITEASLRRQFIIKDERNTNSPLRLSALGQPAMELICRQFFPGYQDETTIDLKTRCIFYEGDTFEGLIWFILQSAGYIQLSAQDTVEWEGVQGHTDGRVMTPDGEEWLLEFKTMNDKKFKRIQKEGMDIPEYRTQMATYMAATGLPGAWICYNKNNSELMTIVPTKEELEPELRRAKYLVDNFRKCEKFEDAFRYFRTPPVEPRYRQGEIIGFQVPSSMHWSHYKELLYHAKEMKFFTAVDRPYYRIPDGVVDKEGLLETWLEKDAQRYA
jgi:hypothetical protein